MPEEKHRLILVLHFRVHLHQTSVLDSIFIAISWSTKSSPAFFFSAVASFGGGAVAVAAAFSAMAALSMSSILKGLVGFTACLQMK